MFGGLHGGLLRLSYHGFRLGTTKAAPDAPRATEPPIHAAAAAGVTIFGVVSVRLGVGVIRGARRGVVRPVAGAADTSTAMAIERIIDDSDVFPVCRQGLFT